MVQHGNGGGFFGFFKRVWYGFIAVFIGSKWQIKEFLTKHRKLDLNKVGNRSGDVAVLTGGTRGIGFETLKILLTCKFHVIVGCRKIVDGEKAVHLIRSEGIVGGSTEICELDLMSLNSVREFGKSILSKSIPIHLLINNSGIMFAPFKLSDDGYESQFQVNYLGHFLLTNILLQKLMDSGTIDKFTRIVNVSSCAHLGGKINFDNINGEKLYSEKMAYMNSKLMQVISTVELNTKFEKCNLPVRAYSVHPGVVATDLYKYNFLSYVPFIMRLILLSPEQGAQTVVYGGLSHEIENNGGCYLANCKKVRPNQEAYDIKIQKKLLEVSCDFCNIKQYDFKGITSQQNPFIVNLNN